MNGILLRRNDLDAFQEYMEQNVAHLPPDLIWKEWANPDTTTPEVVWKVRHRAIFVYKQVLLEHIGTSSTFKVSIFLLASSTSFWDGLMFIEDDYKLIYTINHNEKNWK